MAPPCCTVSAPWWTGDQPASCFLENRGYTWVTSARWERNLFFYEMCPGASRYTGCPASGWTVATPAQWECMRYPCEKHVSLLDDVTNWLWSMTTPFHWNVRDIVYFVVAMVMEQSAHQGNKTHDVLDQVFLSIMVWNYFNRNLSLPQTETAHMKTTLAMCSLCQSWNTINSSLCNYT